MANGSNRALPVPVRDDDQAPIILRPELAAALDLMMDGIPDAGGDAFESIIGSLVAVTDAADLDAPWRTAGLKALVNQPIVIHAIRKAPSTYVGGLPFFLLIDGAYQATGEVFTVTTGAVSVVAQLAKAWQLRAFPLRCIPREAIKPSASGNFPMHLEMVP